ncbi:hypothetical protein GCM10022228_04790 [Halomonas cibimaris]|uniref:Uncharacterized protein n=1 Tax=Halomonas cibimaris TaxID=657012 RepID=A0ABP7L8S1_9GAMM
MAIEFNADFYLQSKFDQLQKAGQLEEFGLTDVASLKTFFEDNGVDAEQHYLDYGMAEGLNPSAEFDTGAYLTAKLAELQNTEKYGDTYADFTVQDVVDVFQASDLTALEHFNTYGKDEGLEATPVGSTGTPSDLTEALEQYETAIDARDTAFDEFVEAAEGANLPKYADDVKADDYIADSIEGAEDALAGAKADLSGDRDENVATAASSALTPTSGSADTGFDGTQFSAANQRDAADGSNFAKFYNEDLIEDGQRLSDARLEDVVNEAQTALNKDGVRYNEDGEVLFEATSTESSTTGIEVGDFVTGKYDSNGDVVAGSTLSSTDVVADKDVYTARQLQSKMNAAQSDLDGDINRKGSNLDLGGELNAAIASFLEDNNDVAGLDTVRSDYNDWVEAIENDESAATIDGLASTWAGNVDSAIEGVFEDVDSAGTDRGDADTDNVIEGVSDSIVTLLDTLDDRFEKQETVANATDNLGNTPTGFDFLLATAMQDDRDGLIAKEEAASELVDTLEGLKGDHEAAVSDVSDAADELGYEVKEADDGILFGEADTDDLFTFDTEALEDLGFVSVTLNELEAGDALFFGTEVEQGNDIEAGDNNALELFVTTNNADDTVLEVENSAYGSEENDTLAVTLTGISEDQVSFDDGVLAIA